MSSVISEAERFNVKHPNLCPSLRWKGQFISAEPDPTVQPSNDGLFWCIHTQNCIGPDGDWLNPATAARAPAGATARESANSALAQLLAVTTWLLRGDTFDNQGKR